MHLSSANENYAAPTPLQYTAPARHAAPTMNEMAFEMYSSDLDRLCRARVIQSFSPIRKAGELHTTLGDCDGDEHGWDFPDVLQQPHFDYGILVQYGAPVQLEQQVFTRHKFQYDSDWCGFESCRHSRRIAATADWICTLELC